MKLGVSFGWLLLNLYRSRLVFTLGGQGKCLSEKRNGNLNFEGLG